MKKLFFCLLYFFGFIIPSFASFPEHGTREMLHRYCGTSEDPNYYKAVSELQHAMRLCFNVRPQNPYFFPEATKRMIDISGHKVFYFEGFLSWDAQVPFRSEDDMLCTRTIGRATETDIPVLFFQDENQIWRSDPPVYIEEEQTFNLRKDYVGFLSAFKAIERDLAFCYKNNKDFLYRRIQDGESYYRPRTFYGYTSLGINDFKEIINDYDSEYQRRFHAVEQDREVAAAYCKRSLDYCIAHHDNPSAYVNRGLFDYLDGNVVDAIDLLHKAIKKSKPEDLEALKENAFLLKGRYTGEKIATTWGKIHYAKDGVHVVPTRPR